jgi:hypothetical protein
MTASPIVPLGDLREELLSSGLSIISEKFLTRVKRRFDPQFLLSFTMQAIKMDGDCAFNFFFMQSR